MFPTFRIAATVAMAFLANFPALLFAQLEFESPPISYSETTPHDAISALQKRIDSGDFELKYDNKNGYLAAVLDALEIPRSSQMLVFSKTSLQLRRISPKRPRAVYFNDETYIGWVQDGDVIEVSTVDPDLGAVFYTLPVGKVEHPKFVRDRGQCMTCHASSRTEGVPGHLMRSVFTDRSGQPHFGSGTYTTKQSSPLIKRWGGWYVSGTHGEMRHMGNVLSLKHQRPEDLDREYGANATDLSQFVDTSPYLEKTSDIVALLVLGHQLEMHNLLTRGNHETRSALHYNGVMNSALDRPEDFVSDSTRRRVASVSKKIVRCLLFNDEFPLTSSVKGVSSFQEDFQARGIRDSQGRSLRDFDLKTRIFKYPCSYLIHSDAFDSLPKLIKEDVVQRMLAVLTREPADDEADDDFPHLSTTDRKNILAILKETKPDLFGTKTDSK